MLGWGDNALANAFLLWQCDIVVHTVMTPAIICLQLLFSLRLNLFWVIWPGPLCLYRTTVTHPKFCFKAYAFPVTKRVRRAFDCS